LFGLVRFIVLVIFFIVISGEDAALSPYKRVFIFKKSATKKREKKLVFRNFFFENPILSKRLRFAIAIETERVYVAFGSPYASI